MKLQLETLQVESFPTTRAVAVREDATVGCNFTNRCTYTCP